MKEVQKGIWRALKIKSNFRIQPSFSPALKNEEGTHFIVPTPYDTCLLPWL